MQAAAPQAKQLLVQPIQLPADSLYPAPQEVQAVPELHAKHPGEQAWQRERSILEPL